MKLITPKTLNMKKVFTLSCVLLIAVQFSFASSSVPAIAATTEETTVAPAPATLKAADILLPIGSTGKTVNLQELSTMNTADLEKMTGKKMSLFQRMEIKMAQRKLRHSINADGTLKNKKLAMMAGKEIDGETGFHLGGFALGFLLGLIGVLIAYLINDEKHSNRVKWSWIGLGVIVVIVLISIA